MLEIDLICFALARQKGAIRNARHFCGRRSGTLLFLSVPIVLRREVLSLSSRNTCGEADDEATDRTPKSSNGRFKRPTEKGGGWKKACQGPLERVITQKDQSVCVLRGNGIDQKEQRKTSRLFHAPERYK